MIRAYALGLAGGVMLASIAGDVPIWLLIVAAALIAWDVAGHVARVLVKQ
ncbi:hypothetical protein KNU63_gp80 [Gordonia phage RogerDodger]|uniref:Uncharacterized protein n=1 Tax=Gordonia phage RogerDodger TaxID=2591116 RepID=A0A515MHL9_9CAUD|nr:hypothetical protein KNU63_gp80 [Gordonia phage RogerDodger]QDM56162.1 hypothetical protein SEA_ROGERDODGER_80 [Gordonia phage RogerDodger]